MGEILAIVVIILLVVIAIAIGYSLYLYRTKSKNALDYDLISKTRQYNIKTFNRRLQDLLFQFKVLFEDNNQKSNFDDLIIDITRQIDQNKFNQIDLKELLELVLGKNKTNYKWQYGDDQYSVDALLDGGANQKKDLIIDSKMPFEHFYTMIVNPDKRSKKDQENLLIEDINKYIKNVKEYINIKNTYPIVFAYINNQAIFSFLYKKHLDLLTNARNQQVYIVSPILLLMILINFKKSKIENQSDKLYNELLKFKDEFEKFADKWNYLHKQLHKFNQDFDSVQRNF